MVTEILDADGKVGGVRLRDVMTGEERTLDVTGVFVAIGHDPRSELFRRPGRHGRQPDTCWSTRRRTRTNLTGVFAAGDLVDHIYRQAITAAGTGCAAALDAERYIAALRVLTPYRRLVDEGIAMAAKAVTDATFDARRAAVGQAGPGGLLGGVVRARAARSKPLLAEIADARSATRSRSSRSTSTRTRRPPGRTG